MGLKLDFKLPLETGLKKGEEKNLIFDVAILGGGPAGMTAAVYTARKQLSTVLISPDLGGQVLETSGIENYLGYQYVTGPELALKFSEQIQQFPLKLAQGERIDQVRKIDDIFNLKTDANREIKSRSLIIATGKRSRKLGVPGEEEYRGRGVSYCAICDGPFFKGQPIAIAGGGNSAITAAIDMLQMGSAVTVVNDSQGWQADEILMQQVKDKVQLIDSHTIKEISGDGRQVTGVKIAPVKNSEDKILEVAGIFIEIGLTPNTENLKGVVAMNKYGEIETDCFSRTSQTGVFAAGDCTTVPEKQIIIAAGEGAKAALAAYRYLKNIPGGD
jgi:alkyl hydroperoxide reductase subunit F